MTEKRCSRCGWLLRLSMFARDASKTSGYKSHCKACDNEKSKRYYAENRERIRAEYVPAPPRELVCAGCGETFVAANGRQRYCKPEHRPSGDRGAKVEAVCDLCGGVFEARARDRARGGGRYRCKSHALRDRSRPSREVA